MKLKVLLIFALVAAGAAAIVVSLGGLPTSAASGPTYLTAAATVGDVADEIAASGSIETTATYTLAFGSAARLAGDDATDVAAGSGRSWTVAEVSVDVGDTVTAGDVLATAETGDLAQEIENAALGVRSAKVQLRAADAALDDAEDDDVTDAIRQAKIGLYNAEIQLAQATTTWRDLRAELGQATLTAPLDGLVTAVDIVAGADAPSGSAMTLAATDYEITASVVESDIASVVVGQAATITIDALATEMTGTVSAISPVSATSDGSVVSYPVTIRIDEPPVDIRSGMTADVTITTASVDDVLTIPSEALGGSDGDYTVRVLDATGTPEARPVEVGLVTETLAEIAAGLAEGETVVTGTVTDRDATTTDPTNLRGNFPAGGGGAIPGGNFGGGVRP